MKKSSLSGAIVSILICEAVGFISSLLSGNTKEIYQSLNQPPLAPPSWLFGVVWPILFALMGIAVYRVYISDAEKDLINEAIFFFTAQLIVNFLWPIIFFRFQLLWAAVVTIVVLLILVLITLSKFRKIDTLAFWLMIPYLAWLLFAAYLNVGFALLN